jgi:hypothetical protein
MKCKKCSHAKKEHKKWNWDGKIRCKVVSVYPTCGADAYITCDCREFKKVNSKSKGEQNA